MAIIWKSIIEQEPPEKIPFFGRDEEKGTTFRCYKEGNILYFLFEMSTFYGKIPLRADMNWQLDSWRHINEICGDS